MTRTEALALSRSEGALDHVEHEVQHRFAGLEPNDEVMGPAPAQRAGVDIGEARRVRAVIGADLEDHPEIVGFVDVDIGIAVARRHTSSSASKFGRPGPFLPLDAKALGCGAARKSGHLLRPQDPVSDEVAQCGQRYK